MENGNPNGQRKHKPKQTTTMAKQVPGKISGVSSEAALYIASQYASQLQEMEATINKLRMTADAEKLKVAKNEEAIAIMRKKAEEQTISAGLHDADIEEQHKIFERISDLRNAVDSAQRDLDASEAENKNLEDVIVKLSDDIREVKASLDVIDFQRHKYNKEYEDLSQIFVTTVTEREKLMKNNREIISKFLEEKQKWQSDMRQFKGSSSSSSLGSQQGSNVPPGPIGSQVIQKRSSSAQLSNNGVGAGSQSDNRRSTQSVINMLNGGKSSDLGLGNRDSKPDLNAEGSNNEGGNGYFGQNGRSASGQRHRRHSTRPSVRGGLSNTFLNKSALPNIGSTRTESRGGTDDSFSQSFQSEVETTRSYTEDNKNEHGDKIDGGLPQRSQVGFFKGTTDLFDDNEKFMTTPALYQVMYEILCNTPDVNAGLINFSNILATENQNQHVRMQQAKVTIAKMRTQQTADNSNRYASKKAEKMLEEIEENMKKIETKQKDLKMLLLTAYNAIAKIVVRFNVDSPNIDEIDRIISNSEEKVQPQEGVRFGSMSMFIKEYDGESYPCEDEILDIIGCVEISINDYMLKFARSHGGNWNQGVSGQKITQYTVGFPDETSIDYIKIYESIVKNNTQITFGEEEQIDDDTIEAGGNEDDGEETFGFKALGKIKEHLRRKAKTINELESGMSIKKDDIEQYRNEVTKELEKIISDEEFAGSFLSGL